MGRKRTSTRKKLTLSIERELLEKLKEWEVNKSLLFTEAAKKMLEEMEKKNNN